MKKFLGDNLEKLNIKFSYQDKRFFHSHNNSSSSDEYINFIPDFIIDNLIIEIDGWYHNKVIDKDNIQDEFCINNGYKVLRITNEFLDNNDLDVVISKIKEMLTSTTIEKQSLK